LKVTIHGSCLNTGKVSASTGVAAYWGPSSRLNMSARVWGGQMSPQVELVAAWLAIKTAPL
ncbi:hypothetical protein DFH08DRAFT_719832, partial [Mycena albidolilacea]